MFAAKVDILPRNVKHMEEVQIRRRMRSGMHIRRSWRRRRRMTVGTKEMEREERGKAMVKGKIRTVKERAAEKVNHKVNPRQRFR